MGVLEIAHGAEWNVDHAIHIVVTVGDHVLEHANDLIGNAVNAHRLPDRILAGEKFLFHVVAEDGDAAVSEVLLFAKEAALGDIYVSNPLIA